MKKTHNLGQINLFAGLSESQLEKLESIAVPRKVIRGEQLFSMGQDASGFYSVEDGRVKIYRESLSGKEQIIHIFGCGEIFGEVPVFQGTSYPASAVALEDSTLLYFSRDRFERIIKEDSSLAMSMLALLSGRLRQMVNKVAALSLEEVPGRLASYLLLLKTTQNSNVLELDLQKGQIAAYLGTIQETLSRIFKKMSEQGLIKVDKNTVEIIDEASLELIASGEEQL
ncbi:Crp/Fnr family transcriptional regulator [Desulfovibrio gilichinskyi]|uniref:CRP/FNR family transcriptional regulator, anaerobic regulatory protein n=1 Tax=Desulfovibrio gilichinskyi TaxID=1519643 RepID=A0A1X7DSB5_9BACT|nr:Crp/Fnr family transcriptional regulator [Desulfovibrio gilichinskyi]SMF20609.1 CRP/FNR family transcriptional regulator, anaerobic regulatory protein [Desulfovibrio gilichinskyi]